MAPDQAVPAGWYPDPYSVSEMRWWDGANWTESVHPPVAPPPPVAPAPIPAPVQVPVVSPPVQATNPFPMPPASAEANPQETQAPNIAPPVTQAPVAPFTAGQVESPTVVPTTPVVNNVEPSSPSPSTALPSRRQLRSHETDESSIFATPASATEPAQQSQTIGNAAPKPAGTNGDGSFSWIPEGPPLGNSTSAFPAVQSQDPLDIFNADSSAASAPVTAKSATAWGASSEENEPGSRNVTRKSTASGWIIALMPLIFALLATAAVKGAENYPRYVPNIEWWMLAAAVLGVLYIVTIILAIADRSKLDWAGHSRPASWAWTLLTAPVYLLVRTIAVKRETGRFSALLLVWILLAAALVGGWFALENLMPDVLAPYQLPFIQ